MALATVVLIIIGLGIFLSHIFNIVKWFIPLGALINMVLALGMLFNIISKKKDAEKEKLTERLEELEAQLGKQNK